MPFTKTVSDSSSSIMSHIPDCDVGLTREGATDCVFVFVMQARILWRVLVIFRSIDGKCALTIQRSFVKLVEITMI